MNILSNNISIDISDFSSLFQESSNDLLGLARNPKKYIKEDLFVEEWYDEEKLKKDQNIIIIIKNFLIC